METYLMVIFVLSIKFILSYQQRRRCCEMVVKCSRCDEPSFMIEGMRLVKQTS